MGTCTERRSSELTDTEFYRQEIFGAQPCDLCGARPISLLALVALPESKLLLRDALGVIFGRYGQPLALKKSLATEDYYHVAEHAACERCAKTMEQTVAHKNVYGDSAYVVFDRGSQNRMERRHFAQGIHLPKSSPLILG